MIKILFLILVGVAFATPSLSDEVASFNTSDAFAYTKFRKGLGITKGSPHIITGILDEGVFYNHVDMLDNYVATYDFIYEPTDEPSFLHTSRHGMHCASIIAASEGDGDAIGASPQSRYISLDVIGAGSGISTSSAKALAGAALYSGSIEMGVSIFNASFQVDDQGWDYYLDDGATKKLEQLYLKNKIFVISAGNDGLYRPSSRYLKTPCNSWKYLLCMGGSGESAYLEPGNPSNLDNSLGASRYGPGIEFYAPMSGYRVASYVEDNSGLYGTIEQLTAMGQSPYAEFGGTSAAAPFVAGLIASMRSLKPTIRLDEIKDILRVTSMPMSGNGNKFIVFGDALEYVAKSIPQQRYVSSIQIDGVRRPIVASGISESVHPRYRRDN
jgi:serine protease